MGIDDDESQAHERRTPVKVEPEDSFGKIWKGDVLCWLVYLMIPSDTYYICLHMMLDMNIFDIYKIYVYIVKYKFRQILLGAATNTSKRWRTVIIILVSFDMPV